MIIEQVSKDIPNQHKMEMGIQISAKAFNILSAELYANPIQSIIRELVSNGVDASIKAGVTTPVIVTIPTEVGGEFSVQDSGCGISLINMIEVFSNYFASDKENSEVEVGGYGLGAKIPFVYTNEFKIETTSSDDGVRRTFVFDKHSGLPTYTHLNELDIEDSEIKGTKISFNLKSIQDASIFASSLNDIVWFNYPIKVCMQNNESNVLETFYKNNQINPERLEIYKNKLNQDGICIIPHKEYRIQSHPLWHGTVELNNHDEIRPSTIHIRSCGVMYHLKYDLDKESISKLRKVIVLKQMLDKLDKNKRILTNPNALLYTHQSSDIKLYQDPQLLSSYNIVVVDSPISGFVTPTPSREVLKNDNHNKTNISKLLNNNLDKLFDDYKSKLSQIIMESKEDELNNNELLITRYMSLRFARNQIENLLKDDVLFYQTNIQPTFDEIEKHLIEQFKYIKVSKSMIIGDFVFNIHDIKQALLNEKENWNLYISALNSPFWGSKSFIQLLKLNEDNQKSNNHRKYFSNCENYMNGQEFLEFIDFLMPVTNHDGTVLPIKNMLLPFNFNLMFLDIKIGDKLHLNPLPSKKAINQYRIIYQDVDVDLSINHVTGQRRDFISRCPIMFPFFVDGKNHNITLTTKNLTWQNEKENLQPKDEMQAEIIDDNLKGSLLTNKNLNEVLKSIMDGNFVLTTDEAIDLVKNKKHNLNYMAFQRVLLELKSKSTQYDSAFGIRENIYFTKSSSEINKGVCFAISPFTREYHLYTEFPEHYLMLPTQAILPKDDDFMGQVEFSIWTMLINNFTGGYFNYDECDNNPAKIVAGFNANAVKVAKNITETYPDIYPVIIPTHYSNEGYFNLCKTFGTKYPILTQLKILNQAEQMIWNELLNSKNNFIYKIIQERMRKKRWFTKREELLNSMPEWFINEHEDNLYLWTYKHSFDEISNSEPNYCWDTNDLMSKAEMMVYNNDLTNDELQKPLAHYLTRYPSKFARKNNIVTFANIAYKPKKSLDEVNRDDKEQAWSYLQRLYIRNSGELAYSVAFKAYSDMYFAKEMYSLLLKKETLKNGVSLFKPFKQNNEKDILEMLNQIHFIFETNVLHPFQYSTKQNRVVENQRSPEMLNKLSIENLMNRLMKRIYTVDTVAQFMEHNNPNQLIDNNHFKIWQKECRVHKEILKNKSLEFAKEFETELDNVLENLNNRYWCYFKEIMLKGDYINPSIELANILNNELDIKPNF